MSLTAALLAIATAQSPAIDLSLATTPVAPDATRQLTAEEALACAAAHYRAENLARKRISSPILSSKGLGGTMPAAPHAARAQQMQAAGDAWRDHSATTLGRGEILAQYSGRPCTALG